MIGRRQRLGKKKKKKDDKFDSVGRRTISAGRGRGALLKEISPFLLQAEGKTPISPPSLPAQKLRIN